MKVKKLFSILLSSFFILLVGWGVFNWDTVLGMLGIGGDSSLSINKGLVAHWPLSQESLRSSTIVADITPNGNHGTISPGSSAGFVTDQKGQANNAYDFDGADTYISMGNPSDLRFGPYEDFAISAWIYRNTEDNYDYILDDKNASSLGVGYNFKINSDNTVGLTLCEGSLLRFSTGSTVVHSGAWHHIVVSVDRSGIGAIYIDGVYDEGSDSISSYEDWDLSTGGTNNLTIGMYSSVPSGNISHFDGSISDVRIYNRTLSEDEISLLYESYNPKLAIGNLEKGLVGHWELDQDDEVIGDSLVTNGSFEGDFTTGLASSWYTDGSTSVSEETTTVHLGEKAQQVTADLNNGIRQGINLIVGVKYKASAWVYVNSGGAKFTNNYGNFNQTTSTTGEWIQLTQIFTATDVGTQTRLYSLTSPSDIIWDDVSIEPFKTSDSTPYSNHGTLIAGAGNEYTTDQRGQSGKAYDFDGADTTIETTLTSNDDFLNGFTVSAWIKPESIGETNGQIVNKATAGDGASIEGFSFGLSSLNPKVYFMINSSTNTYSDDDTTPYDQWTHVLALVKNVSGVAKTTFYINGQLSGSEDQTSGSFADITTESAFTIGNKYDGTRTFDGQISDVRVYNRVLSTDEISELYESYDRKLKTGSLHKGLVGYWPLKSKYYNSTTNRMDDISAYSHHGTFTAGSGSVGSDYATFDGSATTITISDSDNLSFGNGTSDSPFSISMWIKGDSFGTNDLFSKYTAVGSKEYKFRIESSKLYFYLHDPNLSTYEGRLYATALTGREGEWLHLVVTYDGRGGNEAREGIDIYLNEIVVDNANSAVSLNPTYEYMDNTDSDVYIGSRTGTDLFFDGQMSEVRLYSRVLSTDEISLLYKMGH